MDQTLGARMSRQSFPERIFRTVVSHRHHHHEGSIRKMLLRQLALLIHRHPYTSLLVLVFLSALAAWHTGRLDVATNLHAFAPLASRDREAWQSVEQLAPPHAPILAVIDLESPIAGYRLDPAKIGAVLAQGWTDLELVASASTVKPLREGDLVDPRALVGQMLPGDLDKMPEPALLDTLRRRAQAAEAGESIRWRPYLNSLEPSPARILLELHPTQGSDEMEYCLSLERFLTKTFAGLKRIYPRDLGLARVTFQGPHIQTALIAAQLKQSLIRSGIVLALCMTLLMILAFRKVESLIFVGLPPLVGLLWTSGAVSWFFDSVSLLSVVFAVMLMALGVEYAMQIYHRFIEELYREKHYFTALGTAYAEAGRGVIVCTFATSLIFLSFYLSSFQNLRELALVGTIGIFCMTASILLWLPLLAALKSRLARGRVTPLEGYDFGLKGLSASVIASPRTVLALGLVVTAYLAYFSKNASINHEAGLDFRALPGESQLASPEGAVSSRNDPLWILAEAPSLQGALEANDRLYANLGKSPIPVPPGEIDSLTGLLPSIATQQAVREKLRRLDIGAVQRSLRAASAKDAKAKTDAAAFLKALRAMQAAALTMPFVSLETLPSPEQQRRVQSRIVHTDGTHRALTVVYPRSASTRALVGDLASLDRKTKSGLDPNALRFKSETLENRSVARAVIYSIAFTSLLAAISLLVCLLPHFHERLVDTLLAMLPLACAAVWTLGALALLRTRVSLYTLLAFPILAGVALDQAVVLIQRLRERRYASLRQVLRAGGRPNILSSLALLLAIGCLGQTNFPAFQEMALVGVIAVAASTTATLVLIPALLQIRQEGGLGAWISGPED